MAKSKKAKVTKTKAKKAATKIIKQVAKKTKKTTRTVKARAQGLLKNAKKVVGNAKGSATHLQDEITTYVKANPIKSVSAVALTALIAGYLAHTKK